MCCRLLGRAGKEAWKAHNEKGAEAYSSINQNFHASFWVALE